MQYVMSQHTLTSNAPYSSNNIPLSDETLKRCEGLDRLVCEVDVRINAGELLKRTDKIMDMEQKREEGGREGEVSKLVL